MAPGLAKRIPIHGARSISFVEKQQCRSREKPQTPASTRLSSHFCPETRANYRLWPSNPERRRPNRPRRVLGYICLNRCVKFLLTVSVSVRLLSLRSAWSRKPRVTPAMARVLTMVAR